MRHPFLAFSVRQRLWGFWIFFILNLIVMVVLRYIDVPLQTTEAPQGIVSYELAGDTAEAEAILASWDTKAQIYAGFSLGFDYLFMFFYGVTIALACLWGVDVFGMKKPGLAQIGIVLAWLMGIAALLDAVENVALWRMLVNGVSEPWPQIAFWCALVKFGLIGLGLFYVLISFVGWLARRMRSS